MTNILPAGTYFIGDPCYVYDKDKWDSYCCKLFDSDGFFEINGVKLCAFNTAYGDGTYADASGSEYPVDAGLIGATHISAVLQSDYEELGLVVTFANDFGCSKNGSVLNFGHISIDTDDENDDRCDECDNVLEDCECEICDGCGEYTYDCICDD